jgi:hypothetical protein
MPNRIIEAKPLTSIDFLCEKRYEKGKPAISRIKEAQKAIIIVLRIFDISPSEMTLPKFARVISLSEGIMSESAAKESTRI